MTINTWNRGGVVYDNSMAYIKLLLFLASSLFGGVHLIPLPHTKQHEGPAQQLQLCPSLPQASLSADQLTTKVQDSLKQLDQAVKTALLDDKSPGGAVLSLVYKDSVVWTGGYGLKNMSGESSPRWGGNLNAVHAQFVRTLFLRGEILSSGGKCPPLMI